MDSNHDKGLQRPLCYLYTTGQTEGKIAASRMGGKEKTKACVLPDFPVGKQSRKDERKTHVSG